jgi:DNA-binding transcriptional LysR family regulator
MELRQIRYFVAVAEELHFSRAAGRVHVVQPALSQQVKKLEQELGVMLLVRTRRRVSLTAAGRAFLEEARWTLASARRAQEAARRAAAGETGRLRVGSVDWAIYQFLPLILRRYQERYPGVNVQIFEASREELHGAFAHESLDVAFFAFREGEAEFSHDLVALDPMLVVLPDTHPAAAEPSVPLETLAGEPWVLFPPSLRSRYLELVVEACAAKGFTPRVAQEASQMNTLAALVGAGFGVTLLPTVVANRPRAGIVVRPLAGEAPRLPLDVIWRPAGLSPVAERFLEVTREVRDEREPAAAGA